MKPSWDDSPKWAKYLTMDDNGAWYWYENRPKWDKTLREWRDDGEQEEADRAVFNVDTPKVSGRDTLEKRPVPNRKRVKP